MIFINVTGPFLTFHRQFETDNGAEKFLKQIKRIQSLMIKQQVIKNFDYVKYVAKTRPWRIQDMKLRRDVKMAVLGKSDISGKFGLKVSIQNTDAAQLNFHHQLK